MVSDKDHCSKSQSLRLHDQLPLDRRGYLKYTSAAVGGSLVTTGSATGRRSYSDTPPAPTNLSVEYEHTPNNIRPSTDSPPRLTWELPVEIRGYNQSAYRVLVAKSRSALKKGEANVWDSGKVDSDLSTTVEYKGSELDANITYHWKVRVWNQEGKASPWSSPVRFTTAISEEQWQADWIQAGLPDENESTFERTGPLPLLRTEFGVPRKIQEARVHISAPGTYELHLNGDRIGDRVLDPARTNYQETVLYSTYDVADSLSKGTNAVGVALGHGRPGEHDERVDVSWESDDPVLRFQLHLTFMDGSTTTIESNNTWRATYGPTRWDSLLPFQEFYDARKENQDWARASYDDSGWQSVDKVSGPPGDLTPQRVQPMEIQDTIDPVEMWEPEDGVYVFDLGQMIAGWVELTVDGERGTQVTLREAEKLNDDGTVEKIDYAAETLWQEYVLSGEGTDVWEPSFTYGGFRYVQIENYPGEPTLDSIKGKVIHTAVDEGETGSFTSSNKLLNQIDENTRWAKLNNLHGQHTDSPTWEKLGWTEHTLEMGPTMMRNFSMDRFLIKFFRDCRDSQVDNGNIPYVVPHHAEEVFSGWPPAAANDPGWDGATVLTAWHVYQYTGDQQLLRKHYKSMKKYVRFVQRNTENGTIVRTGLGDWNSPGHEGVPPEGPAILSTSIFYKSAKIMSEAANILGKPQESAEFNQLSEEIRVDFNNEFFSESNSIYSTGQIDDYRQTSNIYPLAFNIIPESHRGAVVENLVQDVRVRQNGHLNTGAHGTKHLFPVLSEHGYHDLAYEVATQTTYPSWGHWIENGMTSLLENWELEGRSRNHDFFGSVVEWFYRYLAGIRKPQKPGFKRIEIAPKPTTDLDHAEASIETVRGTIACNWKRTESRGRGRNQDGVSLETTIPGNANATVRIPTLDGEKVRVRESRRTIWINGHQVGRNNPGVKSVERDGDAVVVKVGSGDYQFELEQIGNGRDN